ncbi:MAG: hypothetical protein IIX33_05615, partial [Oscillospiraceae bacterium]|nr:hypothetical protein [Oscillospiraceae bacterium]
MSIVAFFYNFSGSGFFAAQESAANRFSFAERSRPFPTVKRRGYNFKPVGADIIRPGFYGTGLQSLTRLRREQTLA